MSNRNEYVLPNGATVTKNRYRAGRTLRLCRDEGEFNVIIPTDSFIIMNSDDEAIDIAYTIESAIHRVDALSGIAAYAVSQEEDEQSRLDLEYTLQCDEYGLNGVSQDAE